MAKKDLFGKTRPLFSNLPAAQKAAQSVVMRVVDESTFKKMVEELITEGVSIRQNVLYTRSQRVSTGMWRVEFHSRKRQNDCLLIINGQQWQKMDGSPLNPMQVWQLPSWEVAPESVNAEFASRHGLETSSFDKTVYIGIPAESGIMSFEEKATKAA